MLLLFLCASRSVSLATHDLGTKVLLFKAQVSHESRVALRAEYGVEKNYKEPSKLSFCFPPLNVLLATIVAYSWPLYHRSYVQNVEYNTMGKHLPWSRHHAGQTQNVARRSRLETLGR